MRLGALICAFTRRRLPGLAARAAAAGETAPPRHVQQCPDCKREWAALAGHRAGVVGRAGAAAGTGPAAGDYRRAAGARGAAAAGTAQRGGAVVAVGCGAGGRAGAVARQRVRDGGAGGGGGLGGRGRRFGLGGAVLGSAGAGRWPDGPCWTGCCRCSNTPRGPPRCWCRR